jgi:alpha-N-acetylglucosamine transferase
MLILLASQKRSKNIPFIVLATKGVSEAKREHLHRDGAIVLIVDSVEKLGLVKGGASNGEQVLDKDCLWEIVQFDQICFMDGDTVLNRLSDDIFLEPAAALHQTLNR